MVNDQVFLAEHGEAVKGFVHLGIHALAASATLYNAAAWSERREPHLAVNVLVYSSLSIYKALQVWKHFRRPT